MEMERSLFCALLLFCRLWSSVCQEPVVIKEDVGSNVTLVPIYTGAPTEINWKVDGNKVVDMDLNPPDPIFYRYKDRATISPTNGSLTIRNLIPGDSGLYKGEVMVNGFFQNTEYRLTILDNTDVTSSPPTSIQTTSPQSQTEGASSTMHSVNPKKPASSTSPQSETEGVSSTMHSVNPKKPGSSTDPPPGSTTQATDPQKSGMIIGIIAALILIGVVSCLGFFYYQKEKKGKMMMNDTSKLLNVNVEEREPGNIVKSEEEKALLDGPGTEERKAGNNVQSENEKTPLHEPGTGETNVENHVKPEEGTAPLDAAETEETEVKVKAEEESSSLEAPVTEETKAEHNGKPEEETVTLEAAGTEETEAENKVQPGGENSLSREQETEETEAENKVQPGGENSLSREQETEEAEAENKVQPGGENSLSREQETAL